MNLKQGFTFLIVIGLFAVPLVSWQLTQKYPAPPVTFTTITGKKISLRELHGKPVIITFWATDCAACIAEIPHLQEIYHDYHNRGLQMIAVAMAYDPPNHVVKMTKIKQLPYHVALDLPGSHAKAFGNVQLTPSTFLISPEGNIIMKITGPINLVNMKKRIDTLFTG